MYARRLHNAFRDAIEDGDGRTDEHWLNVERPVFEHYTCSMYLSGVMSYLEDNYGRNPWKLNGANHSAFENYIDNSGITSFQNWGLDSQKLDALVCIRNAVVHNGGDLSQNHDQNSLSKVTAANIPFITINNSVVKLHSTSHQDDFMEFVRQCFLSVCMYPFTRNFYYKPKCDVYLMAFNHISDSLCGLRI